MVASVPWAQAPARRSRASLRTRRGAEPALQGTDRTGRLNWQGRTSRRRIHPRQSTFDPMTLHRFLGLLAGLAVAASASLSAQRAAVAADTSRRDTSAAATDPVSKFLESFTYRALGPAAYSGRVTAIAVPRSAEPRPKTCYVGAAGGGVWKTANGGVTWQSVSSGLGSETVGDLAVAPSDSNVLWVGTGEKNSLRSQYWGDGVYKTTDGGKTWTRILFVDDTTGFVDLAMDPNDPNTLYAAAWHRLRWGGGHMEGVGAGSGLYKTTDGGKTWTRLTDPAKPNGLPSSRIGRIG